MQTSTCSLPIEEAALWTEASPKSMALKDHVVSSQHRLRVTDTPSANWDGARMMGLRATGDELRARRDEVGKYRSCERHKSMKTEMKKETRWNETRILD